MAQGCVAAGKGHRVCVWRLRDHSSVVCHLPDLVTSLQWRRGQEEGEALMLLVGTMGGRMMMVRVDRVAVNLPMELKVTELDQWRIDGGGELQWKRKRRTDKRVLSKEERRERQKCK